MFTRVNQLLATSLLSLGIVANGMAATEDHSGHHDHHMHHDHSGHHHGDTMLMGTHIHKKGDWMLSYRFMRMDMEDNGIGTSDIDPDTIVTTAPNRFAGMPMQPPTLRVVPTRMTMDMHMFGAMYGVSDDITVMAMLPYLRKDMDHVTYMGGMGTTVLGNFTTRSDGIGDAKLKGLYRLHDDRTHHVHGSLGISFPTGSNTETDDILTPMGGTPTVRLPYPMQLGSGTWDILAGLTYTGMGDTLSWGAQYSGIFRTGTDEGYRLGNVHRVEAWVGRRLAATVGVAARLSFVDIDNIHGIDPNIVLPVQTADPDRQGSQRVNLTLELNKDLGGGHEIGAEITSPVHEDLDGPQMKSDLVFGITYQKNF